MNLQEELKALKERIAELEEQVKEEREFPQFGDEYWYSNHDGGVLPSTYDNHYMDRDRHSIGNVFRTKEQAEFAVEKLKVEAELRKFSRPFKEYESNYFIQLDMSDNGTAIASDDYYQTQGIIYFGTMEDTSLAIESVGRERIKKYIFGVED